MLWEFNGFVFPLEWVVIPPIVAGLISFLIVHRFMRPKPKNEISTICVELDSKTGITKVHDILPFNETNASIKWDRGDGQWVRRQTKGLPSMTIQTTSGFERIFINPLGTTGCLGPDEVCGSKRTGDLTGMADEAMAQLSEVRSNMQEGFSVKKNMFIIVIVLLAGFGMGYIVRVITTHG